MNQPMAVLTSCRSQEWFTPPWLIEMVREAMNGIIDLDPASHPKAQGWIKAYRYFTREEDGLNREWFGNVWCNPPYGKEGHQSCMALWSQKMVKEHEAGRIEEGILLINSTHGYKWYEELLDGRTHCLLRDRVCFIREDGTTAGPAKRGQTLVHFGADPSRFIETFEPLGRVIPAQLRVTA